MKFLKLSPVFLDIETTGLNPLQDEIVAVGVKAIDLRQETFNPWKYQKVWVNAILTRETADEDELIRFALHFLTREDACIVGYNIAGFDIPFLTARALFNGFKDYQVTALRQRYRIDLMHVVTRYLLTNNRHVKLADIAAFLGISVDDEITGKDIPELYERGEFEKIANHCRSDLEVITALFVKLKDLCIHNLQRRYNLDCEVLLEGVESL